MTASLEAKFLARDGTGALVNKAKRCIRCGSEIASESTFSCDECFKIVHRRMMEEESGDPYRF